MNDMIKISPAQLATNPIELIGSRWMLISAGNESGFNTMTASWGFIGYYANKPMVMVFIRPERYTYEFVERTECFTLSFFPAEFKKALGILGSKSGRDGDKVAEAGLTPCFTENGNPTFAEADIVIECKKAYAAPLHEENFIDKTIPEKWYDEKHGGYHQFYLAEILDVWVAPR